MCNATPQCREAYKSKEIPSDVIFLLEFFFIMMPFPWFYDLEYTPWLFGVPRFIYCWLAYGLLVIGTIALWWRSCMKRPEYQEYED